MPNSTTPQSIQSLAASDPQKEVIARRKPGRPRVVRPAPDHDEFEYLVELAEARQSLIEDDTLLRALERRAESGDVIHLAVVGLAEESARLRFDREQAEAAGFVAAEMISARRVDALGKLASTIGQAKKMGVYGSLDVRGEQFQRVEKLWLDLLKEVAADVLPTETGRVVLDRVASAIAAWRASLESNPNQLP